MKQDLINAVCDICGLWGRKELEGQIEKAVEIMILYASEYSLSEWETFTDDIVAPMNKLLNSDNPHEDLLRAQLKNVCEQGKEKDSFKRLALAVYTFIGVVLVPNYGDTPELRSYIKCIVNLCEWLEKQYGLDTEPIDINLYFKDNPPDEE